MDILESDLIEFSKAAEMYRPMSFFMASRFVSATTPDNAAAPMPQFPDITDKIDKVWLLVGFILEIRRCSKKGKFRDIDEIDR